MMASWIRQSTLGLAALAIGCGSDDGSAEASFEELAKPVLARHAELAFTSYGAAYDGAVALEAAITAFIQGPSATTHDAAKQAWLASRPVYLQTEPYRFYGGPIDDNDGPEAEINSWPMDEAYIDYVEGDPGAGIVNDLTTYPQIDEKLLGDVNLVGGETNVATGYHAIEFLLWGQDLSATGPGDRAFDDYVEVGTRPNPSRRGAYLAAATKLLVEDLASVRDDWAPGKDNYQKRLLAMPARDALGLILKGVGSLSGGELSQERMGVAYETKSQEDEHSCFSDNTHVDHQYDELGIENVYLGRYGDKDGSGLDDLVRAANPALDTEMKQRIADAKAAIAAIPRPFDQAILGDDSAPGRIKIKAAIDALKAQTATIAKIAKALDVELNLE
jgi:putative iron-regulated protein